MIKIDAKIKYATREFNSNTDPMSEHYEVNMDESPMTSSVLAPPENGFSQQMDALQIYAYGMYKIIHFSVTVHAFH